jgi:hypothetical protein
LRNDLGLPIDPVRIPVAEHVRVVFRFADGVLSSFGLDHPRLSPAKIFFAQQRLIQEADDVVQADAGGDELALALENRRSALGRGHS